MDAHAGRYLATIPAAYANSPYPLQYYFEVRQGPLDVALHPGFSGDLNNQPYYVVKI